MCDIIEYSVTVTVKSHDLNGVVTILSSSNQRRGPYQRRTFKMTTLSGSRNNTTTGSSWTSFRGYPRLLNSRQIHIPILRASSYNSSLILFIDLASETGSSRSTGSSECISSTRPTAVRKIPRLARKSLKTVQGHHHRFLPFPVA